MGYLRKIRRRKADLLGGTSSERYNRFLIQQKEDRKIIEDELEKEENGLKTAV